MLLFIGECHPSESNQNGLPELESISNSTWKTTTSQNISIKYCDFSPGKNQTLANDRYTIAISGNPVIGHNARIISEQVAEIGEDLLLDKSNIIKTANGVYCGFHLDARHNRVTLFTDYLGFKKIYYAKHNGKILFANTQWLIEKLLPSKSSFNDQAVIEIGVLGHPLGNRTRRKQAELLPPGHTLVIDKDANLSFHQYHNLTSTQPGKLSEEDGLEALHETWNNAVASRLTHHNTFCFLSGGMDSRLLAHTLNSMGAKPNTANFAPPNTMDRVFAENAAKEMGMPLWVHPTGSLNIDVVTDTINAWTQSSAELAGSFQDRKIWSGDGGSVGMGNVYLDDEMNRLCREGRYTECAQRFCDVNKRVPVARAYRKKNVRTQFEATIAKELENYGQTQGERAAYYFLLFNDQRHHLDRHHETIHLRKFDFELPFFDRRLIELISSLPVDQFNNHRIYDKLFNKIAGSLTSTPWQTYPGHIPCSLPKPPGLAYQWESDFYSSNQEKRRRRTDAFRSLKFCLSPAVNSSIFNRPFIAAASILTLLGLSDHSYLYQCIKPVNQIN